MANYTGGNPWKIDTAGASLICNTDVKISHFEFSGYNAQGSQCQVQDRFGHIVWNATGAADLEEVRSAKIGQVYGISVPILQNNGILLIYFE